MESEIVPSDEYKKNSLRYAFLKISYSYAKSVEKRRFKSSTAHFSKNRLLSRRIRRKNADLKREYKKKLWILRKPVEVRQRLKNVG